MYDMTKDIEVAKIIVGMNHNGWLKVEPIAPKKFPSVSDPASTGDKT